MVRVVCAMHARVSVLCVVFSCAVDMAVFAHIKATATHGHRRLRRPQPIVAVALCHRAPHVVATDVMPGACLQLGDMLRAYSRRWLLDVAQRVLAMAAYGDKIPLLTWRHPTARNCWQLTMDDVPIALLRAHCGVLRQWIHGHARLAAPSLV